MSSENLTALQRPKSPRKIILIDAQRQFRQLLEQHFSVCFPNAAITHFDPASMGGLPTDFSGADYDLLVLGARTGGIDEQREVSQFLRAANKHTRFPPILYFGEPLASSWPNALVWRQLARQGFSQKSVVGTLCELLGSESVDLIRTTRLFGDGAQRSRDTLLPEYQLEQKISHGAVSVYRVRRRSDSRLLALKVLRAMPNGDAQLDSALGAMTREYEVASAYAHPNLLRIYDLAIADEFAVLACEYCANGSLRGRIGQVKNAQQLRDIAQPILSALGALHRHGWLHQDVKPGNILLSGERLVLADFGISSKVGERHESKAGTPAYMSPERSHDELQIDARSDLYSLAIMLYELVCGRLPFVGADPMQVAYQHRHAPRPTLPDSFGAVHAWFAKMIAAKPNDRFTSAEESQACLAAITW